MNDYLIVTIYVVTDDLLKASYHVSHPLTQVSDAEILTVALVAAAYFHNHHERARWVLQRLGYLSGHLSTSRFNRRLHQLAHWLEALLQILSALTRQQTLFLIDTLPLPVCRRVRARRCRKVQGSPYYGVCPATEQRFFGWRLHIVYSLDGIPVSFDLLPARYHDLTSIHELTFELPSQSRVLGDKGYNCLAEEATIQAATGVRLIPTRKKNMQPHDWADDYDLRHYRTRAETFNSQLVNMGIQHLHARSHAGFELKVLASLAALAFVNLL
jgi:hypothetical protein